ncbi:MerR family transcriptional regulator [Sporolactobacillus vineae]|uniref:MerR family transcriptional regulator n=1 Tax=Sporolactobacillus vineae TaxID=444463 RepID=UPI0002882906|nr:MerR family transcriptional regulator [Sporolactobacillus vineae]
MRFNRENIGYFTKTVAERLNMTVSKLRRLTVALEKHGYKMSRNKSNQRIYFNKDIRTIEQLTGLLKRGLTIDDAAEQITRGRGFAPGKAEPGDANLINWDEPAITPSGIPLSESQFRAMIEQVAATTAQKTADEVISRYDREMQRRIELRDRELVTRLREANEASRKKKHWLTKMIGL